MFKIAVLLSLSLLPVQAFSWDPIGDITHPERIINNVTREINNGANQGGTAGRVFLAPISSPVNAINSCVQDLRSCPQNVINQVPEGQLVQTCISDIGKCPDNVIKSIPAQAVWPIISNYKESLMDQARGRWQSLPQLFIDEFRENYPEIDLHTVRYVTNIDTLHGQAITFGNLIFFTTGVNLTEKTDRELMLHELRHTAQYARKGGEQPFLSEYILHATGQIISCRCVNVHDEIGTERDAINSAERFINNFGWLFKVKNNCTSTIDVAISYLDIDKAWKTKYWFNFRGGESGILSEGDKRLHSKDRVWYFFARGNGKLWNGLNSTDSSTEIIDGETLSFRKMEGDSDSDTLGTTVTCSK